MHGGFLRRLRRDTAGNALMIFAGALVPFTILIGSGLDIGIAYMAQAKLQNACDAAVLAGRQNMAGTNWNTNALTEANRFFEFNFPDGSHGVTDVAFNVRQNAAEPAEILGTAAGSVPTTMMHIFGFPTLAINAACDATRDMGHNDVMLVLDVTGSMNDAPSNGGGTKIERLREGTIGLYRALADEANGSITRFGIVPYSHTVNVARSLADQDILVNQQYTTGTWDWVICKTDGRRLWDCEDQPAQVARPVPGFRNNNTRYAVITEFNNDGLRTVHVRNSSWGSAGASDNANRQAYRTSGDGCIEERPSIGYNASPVRIRNTVTRADINIRANSNGDTALQFGRYDPGVQNGHTQDGCPSEAQRLRTYDSEDAYDDAIQAATARVTGGTYHDVGMLWGTRFLSRTGFYAADNPTERDDIPVNQHLVFMTDGMLDTGPTLYSSHGVEQYQNRTRGDGSKAERHIARFLATCNQARSMGITVWVIALDVTNTDLVSPCATSPQHFFTSNGSDLEQIFEDIGQGIGNLRLTR